MNKRSLCNYCLLQLIRRSAKAKKKKVTILADAVWKVRGFNIYVHPYSIIIPELKGGEEGERAKYRQAWMKSIEDHCSC